MKYILLIIAISFSTSSYGQDLGQDSILLKNGIWFTGTMSSVDKDGNIIFKNSKHEYKVHESRIKKVKKISGETVAYKTSGFIVPKTFSVTTGFSILGGMSGLGTGMELGLEYIHHKWVVLTTGIGFDNYNFDAMRSIYSINIGYRAYLSDKKNTPFIGYATGYGFAFKNIDNGVIKAKGGISVNPYTGIRFGGDNLTMLFKIGLKFQEASYGYYGGWNGEYFTEERVYERLDLGFNFIF